MATVGKSEFRRSIVSGTPIITELQEDDIACQFCKTKDMGRWIQCSQCENWMHIACAEMRLQVVDTVPDQLWDRIYPANEWEFTCPNKTCSDIRPIPMQLQAQRKFTRQQLVMWGVSEEHLLKGSNGDGFEEELDNEGSKEEEEERETEQKFLNLPPTITSSGTDPTTGGAVSSEGSQQTGLIPSTSSAPPISMASGGFDTSAFFQFLKWQSKEADKRLEKTQQEANSRMDKMIDYLAQKDERDRQERREREERAEKERSDRIQQEELDRSERKRLQQIQLEKDEKDRQERERLYQSIATAAPGNASGFEPRKMSLQLPKPKLPTFSGDLLKWPEFWDLFETMVDQNTEISDVAKLDLLKTCLSGQAAAIIEPYKITEDNYKAVVDLLKSRYDDKLLIKRQLYQKLRGLPASSGKSTDLRHTFDTIFSICTQLCNMGDSVENQFLLEVIMEKFPAQVHQRITSEKNILKPNTPWDFKLFKEYVDRYIKTMEESYMTKELQPPQSQSLGSGGKNLNKGKGSGQSPTGNKPGTFGSASGLLVGKQASSNKKPSQKQNPSTNEPTRGKQMYPCVFCDSMEHFSQNCTTVQDMNVRYRTMQEAKRCFICLKKGHAKKDCNNPRKDKLCEGCGRAGLHHPALCQEWLTSLLGVLTSSVGGQQGSATNTTTTNTTTNNTTTTGATGASIVASLNPSVGDVTCVSSCPKSVMQTAVIDILKHQQRIPVPARVLLDNGSSTSWMSKKLATRLGLQLLQPRWVTVTAFNTTKPKKVCGYDTLIEVVTIDKQQKMCLVTVIDHLTMPIHRYDIPEEDKKFIQDNPQYPLARGAIPDSSDPGNSFTVEAIFGQDYIWELLCLNQEPVLLPSGLKLLPSVFGYLVGGKYNTPQYNAEVRSAEASYFISTQVNQSVPELTMFTKVDTALDPVPNMADFWDLETIGIRDSPIVNDDDKALEIFNNTIQFVDGRYEVIWSWKPGDIELPDNKGLAWGRFKSLAKRLASEPELRQRYDAIIQDQLDKGIIEKVESSDPTGPRVHYLPHHPVITPQKTTTKLRLVYDASSKERKDLKSLNDCMYRGPVILPDLVGLLLRFRTDEIAILADVEKAFLQVGLQTPERDVTRFYWYKDPTNPDLKDNIQIYRFRRVAFGIICSPFLLEATIRYHLNQTGTPIALKVTDNIYVDNVLIGAKDVPEAQQIYKELKEVFAGAKMNLREFTSNSIEFIETLPEVDRVKGSKAKVLGLSWNLPKDSIQVTGFNGHESEEIVTKRKVLHAVAKIFDPLGFFSPVTFHGKIFLHRLWLLEKKWDDILEENLVVDWRVIEDILRQISSVEIPRYLGTPIGDPGSENYELLVFSDASQQVYGTAVYIRFPVGENEFQTQLIFAKLRLASRVKNTKTGKKEPITLPRLELLAVLIGVRAMNFVTAQLKLSITKKFLWTDSQCVLHWLQSTKPLPVFIENRLKEIRRTTDITYRYIPSAENPADYMTRGKEVSELGNLWWHGPSWLTGREWPEFNIPELTPETLEEIQSQDEPEVQISFLAREDSAKAAEILKIIQLERFSSLGKLLRVTAYTLRYLHNLKAGSVKRTGVLTGVELEDAERFLVKAVQKTAFSEVFYDIERAANSSEKTFGRTTSVYDNKRAANSSQKTFGHTNSLQKQLGLKIDAGLLRCYGRLGCADLPFDAKYQMLLPPGSKYTALVVEEAHRRMFHYGVISTLAQVRMKYWIPRGRRVVAEILKHCRICKAIQGGPYKLRPIPVLPKERVNRAQPFQYVGVDYLGPVYIKSESGGPPTKTWICLFTCLVVRAVHLELARDLSTGQFLNCFRRFVARRGRPDKIISDNAPNFKLANTALDAVWNRTFTDSDLIEYFARERINWVFITEFAPWQGGFYERLVGVVKNALRKGLGRKLFGYEELATILTEIEAVVNARPLTYVSSVDHEGMIISPADFLVGDRKIGLPELSEEDYIPKMDSNEQVVKYLADRQSYVNRFWQAWSRDYLQSLHERYQKEHKTPRIHENREPSVGEIVLDKGGQFTTRKLETRSNSILESSSGWRNFGRFGSYTEWESEKSASELLVPSGN